MPRRLPPQLCQERSRHGKLVWYVRAGHGKRVRIPHDYDTKEFWQAYRDALEGKPVQSTKGPAVGTFSWLVAKYIATAEWSELKPATRKQRHSFYRMSEKTAGDTPLKKIGNKAILAGRDKRRDRPFSANNYIKAMRGLFRWAVGAGYVPSDPTAGIKLLRLKDRQDGFHEWTEDEVARYELRWPVGTRERLALDLLLYTGLRRGDVVRLGRPHVRNGEFSIRTEKTGITVTAPIMPQLAETIAASPTGELTFLATAKGTPFGKESFGNWFKIACVAAGVPGSAHGLRKAGARRAVEDGATEWQLNAIFGWSDGSRESAVYTRGANRAKLAREGRRIPAPDAQVRDGSEKDGSSQGLGNAVVGPAELKPTKQNQGLAPKVRDKGAL
jgi:integrase